MIKIVTGLSAPVGSSVGLTNLCKQLNSRGHDAVLYGPDYWHLDKCPSRKITDFLPEKGDTVIVQNIKLLALTDLYSLTTAAATNRPEWTQKIINTVKRHLPSSKTPKEFQLIFRYRINDLFTLGQINQSLFDKIHFLSNEPKISQHPNISSFFCPDFIEDLRESRIKPERVAGVIGSLRKENKTHEAVEKALKDGMKKIILYGYLSDPVYYYMKIAPMIKKHPGKIQFAGFVDEKQKVYDSVSDVYVAVKKPWSSIKKECMSTKTYYHGPDNSQEDQWMTNDQIYETWKANLGL